MTTNPLNTNSSNTAAPARLASRRSFLLTTGAGAAGAIALGACGTDASGGISGTPITQPSVPPTVAPAKPSQASLDADATQIRTANSLELLTADVYDKYGPKLTDAALMAAAARFATDHRSAAAVFANEMASGEEPKPNEFLEENLVSPIADQLNSDSAIANFLSTLESSITATYVSAAGIFTQAAWRQRIMTYGAASARRAALFGNGGVGSFPTDAMYPLFDLIPGRAFVAAPGTEPEAEPEAEAETETN